MSIASWTRASTTVWYCCWACEARKAQKAQKSTDTLPRGSPYKKTVDNGRF